MSASLHLVSRDFAPPSWRPSRFLRALPPESFARLAPVLEVVQLPTKVVLWEPDTPIQHVYFPHSCAMSVIVQLRDGVCVEAHTIGREGFLGVSVLLGSDTASTRAVVQVAGEASRLSSSAFRHALAKDDALRQFSLLYAHAVLDQTSQSVACNGRHDLPKRCARWLLMTRDRVDRDEFRLTQEYLATMLGVRRATVTGAALMLQRAGLIKYSRGRVTILDRDGLEKASCECYDVVRKRYDQLLGRQRD